jgi:y4mF family transcriptional regulator
MRSIGGTWVKQPDSDIGQFVRERRKFRGWSQQELADYVGVSRALVSDLEIGKPTLRMDGANAVLALFGKRLGLVDLDTPGSER